MNIASGQEKQKWFRNAMVLKIFVALLLAGGGIIVMGGAGAAFVSKVTFWLCLGIMALSLSFVWGKIGALSFGQNAIFGIGAYGYAVAAINFSFVTGETLTALLIGALAATTFAGILGYVLFYGRVSDVYLSILTLAVTLVLYTILSSTAGPQYRIGDAHLGGFNGIPGLPPITLPSDDGPIYLRTYGVFVSTVIAAVVSYILLMVVAESRYGQILKGIRSNEKRMEYLGYDIRAWKFSSFVLAGFVAGIGGGMFAAWGTFVNPSTFGLMQAAMIVVCVILGGRTSLAGGFVGVVLVEWVSDSANIVIGEQTPLILGLALLIVIFLLPKGIVPSLGEVLHRAWSKKRVQHRPIADQEATAHVSTGSDSEDIELSRQSQTVESGGDAIVATSAKGALVLENLTKKFDELQVFSDISAKFTETPIHAIIGPNGAGKSTLFNVIVGEHPPSHGVASLDGREVTRLPSFRRARLGLGIKTQVPSLFMELTVRENLELACRTDSADVTRKKVSQICQVIDLQDKLRMQCEELSHGEQQWLEMGMLLAQNPSAVLLDEPVAGMTREERNKTVTLIKRLAENRRVIVVEHDMQFVQNLECPVLMLHKGEIFRTGTFSEIVADPEVIDAYLGRE